MNDGLNESPQFNEASLTYDQVMSESEFTLDHLLTVVDDGAGALQAGLTEIDAIHPEPHSTNLIDIDTTSDVDPLDFLMTYNSNQS